MDSDSRGAQINVSVVKQTILIISIGYFINLSGLLLLIIARPTTCVDISNLTIYRK